MEQQTLKWEVRRGAKADLCAVLELVQELATYERAAHEVRTTLAEYEQNWIDGHFDFMVAVAEGRIIGMVLYFKYWSTWRGRVLYLEDFVVREEHRRHGVGKVLFEAFLEEARRLDCTYVKWQVLDWNEPALKFYEQYGALIEKDWWNGKIILKKD